MTLRKWIQEQKCLNVGVAPWQNTAMAQLGALEALNTEGLMEKVTGLSGSSMGGIVASLA